MPVELAWSDQARTDLLDIYVLIGLEQPAVAERYLDRIADAGRGPYLLLYRTDPDTNEGPIGAVEIICVVDGCRDLYGLF